MTESAPAIQILQELLLVAQTHAEVTEILADVQYDDIFLEEEYAQAA